MKEYKRLPKGFKLVKSGRIKSGDIVKYHAGWYEDCTNLIGYKVDGDIYRRTKRLQPKQPTKKGKVRV